MNQAFKKGLTAALLGMAMSGLLIVTGCGIKTYNMLDPGRPSQTFMAFYRAVSDGDDAAANELLGNYSWHSHMPKKTKDGGYSVNGTVLSGSDAKLMDCILKSRRCEIVSESDYTRDDVSASVTVRYTSFDIKKFQKELSARAVEDVKEQRYQGKVFNDSADTQEVIEQLKTELLKAPQTFYTTQRFRIRLAGVKGKWKVLLTEDFYKALSGYTE